MSLELLQRPERRGRVRSRGEPVRVLKEKEVFTNGRMVFGMPKGQSREGLSESILSLRVNAVIGYVK